MYRETRHIKFKPIHTCGARAGEAEEPATSGCGSRGRGQARESGALPLLLAHKPYNVITPVLAKFPASLRSAATGASAVRASEWGAADVDVGTEQSGPDVRERVIQGDVGDRGKSTRWIGF
ncbi:hypothetical protein DFH09DRAFT_1281769 [Mycena vulgaris]|nr:hypothetical protein DFH09DRAFT_1281769 [Mycena vulgaris]